MGDEKGGEITACAEAQRREMVAHQDVVLLVRLQ